MKNHYSYEVQSNNMDYESTDEITLPHKRLSLKDFFSYLLIAVLGVIPMYFFLFKFLSDMLVRSLKSYDTSGLKDIGIAPPDIFGANPPAFMKPLFCYNGTIPYFDVPIEQWYIVPAVFGLMLAIATGILLPLCLSFIAIWIRENTSFSLIRIPFGLVLIFIEAIALYFSFLYVWHIDYYEAKSSFLQMLLGLFVINIGTVTLCAFRPKLAALLHLFTLICFSYTAFTYYFNLYGSISYVMKRVALFLLFAGIFSIIARNQAPDVVVVIEDNRTYTK